MIKIREDSDDKGWKALEDKLRQQGLTEGEIRLAESSFRDGLEILKDLFIQSYSLKNAVSESCKSERQQGIVNKA